MQGLDQQLFDRLTGQRKPAASDAVVMVAIDLANCKYPQLQEVCPGLPQDCYQIVDKLLSKAPSRRYKSAALAQREILALREEMEER